MDRWLVYVCLVISLSSHILASNEKLIQVDNFLANVNFSEPKLFYVRNNLDGDIEFQESENASLSVHISGQEKELERIKVEYNLLDGGTLVDIQVFIVPETTTNWPLIGGLAGAGVFVVVVFLIGGIYVVRKRRAKLDLAAREEKFEMRDRGKVVAEKVAVFEKPQDEEELVLDENDAKSSGRPRNRSTLIEKKIATFERPTDENSEKGGEKTENDEQTVKQIRSQSHLQVTGTRNDSEVPQSSRPPRAQSSTFLSARSAFLLLTLIAVALASSKAPTARIVISVPANFVKNGSKIFFNKDFHGRLLLSEGLKGEIQHFQQFAVSPASSKVSSLDKCFTPCEFGCDVQTKTCLCLRGYKMIAGSCHDMDECASKKHNCHVQATCNNTIGGFKCTCKDGYWGDGITCKACSAKPCPEYFYQSESCTRTHDRVCTACTPTCEKTTYQAHGCGLTFDRLCVDISKPLTVSKDSNDSNTLDVRSGSKLIVLKPAEALVLLEDRLRVDSTSKTFFLQANSPNRTRLHRNSSFYVDLEIEKVNLLPKYSDYDAWRSNGENLEFGTVPGFSEVFSKHCRYPAPNHYTIKHDLQRDRQTKVYPAKCFQHSRRLCPTGVTPGEMYHYRSLNDACDTAETSVICSKPNQKDCNLKADSSKLYCTNYTNIVTDVFGISEGDFLDNPLESFPTVFCADAYRICRICRDNCANCDESSSLANSSCSCCYKDCLNLCSSFYGANCARIPKRCAKGDTSQFTLTMNKPTNLNLQFNCYLEYYIPKTLYTLRYKVQHESGRFSSDWISKTLNTQPGGDHPNSVIQQGTNHLDSLEVSHSVNFNISSMLYLRGQRPSKQEPYKYSISKVGDENSALGNANAGNTIEVQTKTPFSIYTRSWSDSGNCQRLSEWSESIRKPYGNLRPVDVDHLGVQSGGEFAYHIQDPQRPPTMTVSISEEESILKYVLTNASIRNDETFKSSLSRTNTTWRTTINGFLTSCPGFFTLQVIDEVDNVLVLEQDVVILCPETGFGVDIHVPRKGLQDKERLFTFRLSNARQKLELQLAVVDKGARKGKEPVKKSHDDKPNPWITLMPLFVVTGCVLLFLFALIVYAQATHKPDDAPQNGPSRWKFVKNKEITKGKAGDRTKKAGPKDQNRLKRRHLILVVFFVVVRVVYSLIFTFSMAFAILTLLHADNMKIIREYQDYVQSKIDESNAMALQMDQHREREAKRGLDASEDVQRSCDFFMGLQLQWLRFNMTCLIQENHLKMFNKLSKKIISKVTERVEKLKKDINERITEFRAATRRKLQDTKERLKNYGKRVYNNGWFALPKAAYKIKKAFSRKKREIQANENYLRKQYQHLDKTLTRNKRSIADSSFIGFLDFVGAVDQDKLVEAENNIIAKLQYAKNGLADFSDVLKTGKSPEHPLSSILMCPLRYMKESAKKQVKKGIQQLAEVSEEWAKAKAECFVGNISDFFASNDSLSEPNENKTDSETFSERVVYEEIDGSDGSSNISKANRSSIIESAHGGSYYNIEKGDVMEEMVDDQKEELLKREGKIKDVTSVYDAEVLIATRNAILGVLVVIDILLLIYRGTKTYQIAFKLIQGFEEIVNHDEDEFEEKPPTVKQRAERLARRILDFLAERFSKFITFCKTLHKRIMRTNLLPMCIIIAASAAGLYLLIAVVFNVMNVTVIEELGGYDMIASRLDTNYRFTNLAIDDQFDFINNNAMQQYKESMNDSIAEYNRMIADFNREQQERMERLNRQLCSLENDTNNCFGEQASLLDFNPQSCIIPTLEGVRYEDYDGEAYRQRLKRETKRFVDAFRNMVLETIYFVLAVVLSVVIISVLGYVAFLFLKSRGMVRVKQVHVYKSLPPDVLEQFHLKLPEPDDEKDGGNASEKDGGARKVNIPNIFLTESTENVNTLKRESKA
ncbi:hypothetical protein ACROYT_G000626 [Oculina patagonica]